MRTGESTTTRLRHKTATVAGDLRELGGLAEQAAAEKLQQVGQAAVGAYELGHRKVSAGAERVANCVRERPLTSLLFVAGVATAIGYLLKRRA